MIVAVYIGLQTELSDMLKHPLALWFLKGPYCGKMGIEAVNPFFCGFLGFGKQFLRRFVDSSRGGRDPF